ncbi:MAG: AAA family ATPase [Proteobacteria bacterium]|nr:AAA family ATPase [Pseudomonadota bacterium]
MKMYENDISPPADIIIDGSFHRFNPGKKRDKSGWYIMSSVYDDFLIGSFGDWRNGTVFSWNSRSSTQDMSLADIDRFQSEIKKQKKAAEDERKRIQEQVSKRAKKIWDRSAFVDNHPYLTEKGVPSYNLRKNGSGLIVPVKDLDGNLWSLQFIRPGGAKRFFPGGRKQGLCYPIPGSESIYICEGYSTGATIHMATGGTVIVAFDAGNLKSVSQMVRKKAPDAIITICGDDDQFSDINAGKTKAEEAARAIRGKVIFPTFENLDTQPTDFNDLAALEGIEKVKAQIEGQKMEKIFPPFTPETTDGRHLTKRPPPVEFLLNCYDVGMLPKGVVGVITATGGTGKTFFCLHLAKVLASGGSFGPINAPRPVKTLFIGAEDPQSILDSRVYELFHRIPIPGFYYGSIYGELGPLMQLDGNVPIKAESAHWLEKTIENFPDLEVLIIDPKSRLYGLNENDADHSTQWIRLLESMGKKYNLTIIFTHHTSKENAGKISQNMSRGSSAIVDGCRWQGGMSALEEKKAIEFGIHENQRMNYIEFKTPKSNYGPRLDVPLVFKREKNGTLKYTNLKYDKIGVQAEYLLEILKNEFASGNEYSRRELRREKSADHISEELKEEFSSYTRSKEMNPMVDHLIQNFLVMEDKNGQKNVIKLL